MTLESKLKLRDFEGLRLKAYDDSTGQTLIQGDKLIGKLTVGYGRNLTDRGISHDEAEMMLANDLNIATAEARSAFDWFDRLDPVRQDFIVMMIFNIGVPRLKGFKKMLAAIEAQDWGQAGAELVDSTWAKQVGNNRADAMRRAIETGEW